MFKVAAIALAVMCVSWEGMQHTDPNSLIHDLFTLAWGISGFYVAMYSLVLVVGTGVLLISTVMRLGSFVVRHIVLLPVRVARAIR